MSSVASFVGRVSMVIAIQITLVEPTVMSSDTWSGMFAPFFFAMKNANATRNDPIIALISLHAFTRHQNHRRR